MRIKILALALIAINLSAQNTYEFLRMDISPRTSALGGSFVAANDDPNVVFFNPAGIYNLSDLPVSFSFAKHLLDINLSSLAASYYIPEIGRIGAGIKYINYGTFTGADEYGNKLSEYGAGEIAFVAGYSNKLDENFFYGANIKFIYSGIAEYSSTALGFDAGLIYAIPDERINVGFRLANFGTQLSKYSTASEDLPFEVSIGVSKKLQHMPLQFFIDFHKLNENNEDNFFSRFKTFSVGGEFTLSKVVKLRVGYDNEKRKELKIGSFAGLAGFNIGLGFRISDYDVGYAYSSWGEVGAIHRFGVTTAF